jgi:hypothetical protein
MVVVVQSAGSGGGTSHFVLGGQAGADVAVQVVLGIA